MSIPRKPLLAQPHVLLVLGVYGFVALYLLIEQRRLLAEGGGAYQHADWLINFASGIVRRGLSGEMIFWSADRLSVDPLSLVAAIQLAATWAVIAALLVKGISLRMPEQVFLMLLSPALVIFWANDPGGAFRKEVLGYLAFLPLLWPGRTPLMLLATAAIFALAVAWHEANAFLAPLLILAVLARSGGRLGRTPLWAYAALLAGMAGAAVLFAWRFARVPSTEAMCDRLLTEGLSPALCEGIFPWLSSAYARNTAEVAGIAASASVVVAILTALACLGTTAILLQTICRHRGTVLVACLGAVPLLLLYVVAVDWGRWLSMQVFGLTFLGLIHAERLLSGEDAPPALPRFALAAALAFSLGFGFQHVGLLPADGLIETGMRALSIRLP